MVNVRALNTLAALIFIGCVGDVMCRSANKIARISFQCRFWLKFFVGACCRFAFTNLFWFWFKILSVSQNSDLGEDQLNEMELKAQAKNTKRATKWGVKKLEKLQ